MNISKILTKFVGTNHTNRFHMPNTKSSDIRYKVLDRCLRRGGYSTLKLMEAVSEELEFQGYEPVTALNTIRNDLRYIENTYPDVHIVENKSGRNKTYAYENPDTSIYKLQFNDDELGQLSQCMAILSQFEGMPQMEWLQSFLERFRLSLNIDPDGKRVVGFDENKYLVGREYFSRLLSAISNKEVLDISYKSFKDDSVRHKIVHPYYIKKYNNRWFLLGRTEGYDTVSTFAFDRIVNISNALNVEFIANTEIDFNDDYFTEMIGVTKPLDETKQKVGIRVRRSLYPYIATKPIHETQRVKGTDDSGVKIEIELYVNYELKQLLLSYGDGIEVLYPDSLRTQLRSDLENALNNYDEASPS